MYATLLKIFPPINPNISAFCSQYLLLETRAARAPHFPQILIHILSWVYCAHNGIGSFFKVYYYCYAIEFSQNIQKIFAEYPRSTVYSRFKKDLKLQIHLHKAFFSDDRFLNSLHKAFLNQTTLYLGKEKWTFLNQEFTVFMNCSCKGESEREQGF
jgi:hypothetical protein